MIKTTSTLMTLLALPGLALWTGAGTNPEVTAGANAGAELARGALELATDYRADRSLRVESETSAAQETVEVSMERDGEPLDAPERGFGGPRSSRRTLIWVDTVGELTEGVPTRVERTFETAEQLDGEDGPAQSSELEGETLEDDGEVLAEADGIDAEQLVGQRLTLPLDALLPEGEVEVGESWEIEAGALLSALGIDVVDALFPRPEVDFEAMRNGGERPAFMRRDASVRLMRAAEWEATATLTDESVEVDGVTALVIELSLEGQGRLEEEERFHGRGRGRAAGGAGGFALLPAATDFEIELEGRLLFSVEAARPVSLEIEGTFFAEMESVHDMGDSVFTMYRAQEGTFEQTVSVTVAE